MSNPIAQRFFASCLAGHRVTLAHHCSWRNNRDGRIAAYRTLMSRHQWESIKRHLPAIVGILDELDAAAREVAVSEVAT